MPGGNWGHGLGSLHVIPGMCLPEQGYQPNVPIVAGVSLILAKQKIVIKQLFEIGPW